MDQVTEFEAQSYATDAALLAELRASWPPAVATDAPAGGHLGYVRADIAALQPVGALRLTDSFAVALAAEPGAVEGAFNVVPLVRGGGDRWRRARPGDGLSAFVAGVPMASERPVGVDQTHDSVVVGERAIVKWFRRVGPGPSRAATLIAQLAAVGFGGIPTPLGSLGWRSRAGAELTLAQGDAYLSGARDGWEWCVERVPDDVTVGRELGQLVASLHRALATPSAVIAEPISTATADDVAGWRAAAVVTLHEALTLDDDPELASFAPRMLEVLERPLTAGDFELQPVHGDLHVGQVLEWSGRFAVIDFDGNPALPDAANAVRQPRERDVAQMLSSLDHVGRVVDERSGRTRTREAERWIGAVREGFLASVGPLDEPLVAAFEVEQECRELVYAARFLPRWRYAPMATLQARYGR
ncbi:MAG TPA: phosphotransferase [Candidatus Limnocylindrales bacterium]|nr:phosphotransferase [Candidatus Limnocylindrales bacterium]